MLTDRITSACDGRDVFSGALKERGLELVNCLASSEQEFLKRLYDGTPVFQRYREGEVRIHYHGMTSTLGGDGNRYCLRWQRRPNSVLDYLLNPDQSLVSVPIREVAEQAEPVWIGSVIRLKPLEKCDVFVADAFQVGIPVTRETLWAAFDRKLDLFADAARILLRYGTREIVERVAQATCKLANHDSDFSREDLARLGRKIVPAIVGSEIRVGVNDVFSEPVQVFACPTYEEFDFFELVQCAASARSFG